MEQEGTIAKSASPWCSLIVLVRKKDGTIRFCVTYRKLNDASNKDTYPLLRIDDILEALRGTKYFYSIDLTSGYWQIKVADKEQEDALIKLKEALCKAPVLAYPNPDVPYIMDTDASNLAIGAVLSQLQDIEEKVIMYSSKAF